MKKIVFSLALLTQLVKTVPPENILSAPTLERKMDMSESPCPELHAWWHCVKDCVEVVRDLPRFVRFLEREQERHELEQEKKAKARNSRALVRVK
jgi:hypothetical protein